jgi:hypothetical protein
MLMLNSLPEVVVLLSLVPMMVGLAKLAYGGVQ